MTKIVINPVDTGLESNLLRAMSVKSNYDLYSEAIDSTRLLSTTKLLLQDYEKYFTTHTAHESIDWGVFYTAFSQQWHARDMDKQDIENYKTYIFPKIMGTQEVDIKDCLLHLLERSQIQKVMEHMKENFTIESVTELMQAYENSKNQILGEPSEVDAEGSTILDLDYSVLDKSEGIPYFLEQLQSSLGSLVMGQFVVVAADKNVGKSAFVISQLVHTFKHLVKTKDNRKILYINSEGTSADVADRFFSNLYHKKYDDGFEEIFENQEKVLRAFKEQYEEFSQNLIIFPMSKINSFNKIKKKVLLYNPALVIIDICDKLCPEEDTTSLKKLYDNLRVLSGEACPIIGTSQAGNTEYLDKETNKLKTRKWLTDNHLYGSKAGKGGSADTMIMIGKDDDDPVVRFINVTKNKRGKALKITCRCIDKFSRYEEISW